MSVQWQRTCTSLVAASVVGAVVVFFSVIFDRWGLQASGLSFLISLPLAFAGVLAALVVYSRFCDASDDYYENKLDRALIARSRSQEASQSKTARARRIRVRVARKPNARGQEVNLSGRLSSLGVTRHA